MRRRLGGAGSARLHVRDRVAQPLAVLTDTTDCRIGFDDDELSRFSDAYRLDAIASVFDARGDIARLKQIAWWGSALADLALIDDSAVRDRVLAEGAVFNLAVALFDSVVDEGSPLAARLAHTLEPRRMSARLSDPESERSRLSCGDPALQLVVDLFDAVLASAGQRLRARTDRLANLSAQLERMYLSELRIAPDLFVAKTGPVVFIGTLAADDEANVDWLYDTLARFCHEWDDWQDMAEDMPRFSPNVFLGKPRRRLSAAAVAYATRSIWRLIGGPLLHVGVAEHLASSLQDVVDAARGCDRWTYCKTLVLCRELVG